MISHFINKKDMNYKIEILYFEIKFNYKLISLFYIIFIGFLLLILFYKIEKFFKVKKIINLIILTNSGRHPHVDLAVKISALPPEIQF